MICQRRNPFSFHYQVWCTSVPGARGEFTQRAEPISKREIRSCSWGKRRRVRFEWRNREWRRRNSIHPFLSTTTDWLTGIWRTKKMVKLRKSINDNKSNFESTVDNDILELWYTYYGTYQKFQWLIFLRFLGILPLPELPSFYWTISMCKNDHFRITFLSLLWPFFLPNGIV